MGGVGLAKAKIVLSHDHQRVDVIDEGNDAGVDVIDIEEDNLTNSDGNIVDLDDDDDDGIFSIANDDILAGEENNLLALRAGRTETNKGESA